MAVKLPTYAGESNTADGPKATIDAQEMEPPPTLLPRRLA